MTIMTTNVQSLNDVLGWSFFDSIMTTNIEVVVTFHDQHKRANVGSNTFF